jgi:hypothetical protein
MTTLLALAFVLQIDAGPALMMEGQQVLEGHLEVIIEDSAGGSRTLYFLISGPDRIPLRFVTPPGNLRTGTRVRLRGNYDADGRFVVVSFERLAGAE